MGNIIMYDFVNWLLIDQLMKCFNGRLLKADV